MRDLLFYFWNTSMSKHHTTLTVLAPSATKLLTFTKLPKLS